MSLRMETITKNSKEIKELFYNSFPKNEQLPIWFLLWKSKMDFVDFFAFYDDDIFIGFTYLISNEDLTLVFYLAIHNKIRSKGYGRKTLAQIQWKYPNNTIILNIEMVDETTNNYEQRVNREKFYLNNGYRTSNFRLMENGDLYDVLINGRDVTTEEYYNLFKKFTGNVLFILFKPKLISIDSKK